MDICSLYFNVTLPDVGENNQLSNKGILRMMQEAACIHSDYAKLSINHTKDNGLAWIILNWKLKVFSRPIWNTSLKVSTWCRKISHVFFYRDFEIYDSDGNLVAIATSKWILFDSFNNKIAKITDDIKKNYMCFYKCVFNEPLNEKLLAPKSINSFSEYVVEKRDIDTNHHVNNLNYLDFAYNVIPDNIFSSTSFQNVEIMYKHEAKLGDSLTLEYSAENNFHYVVISNKKSGKLNCIVKLY